MSMFLRYFKFEGCVCVCVGGGGGGGEGGTIYGLRQTSIALCMIHVQYTCTWTFQHSKRNANMKCGSPQSIQQLASLGST